MRKKRMIAVFLLLASAACAGSGSDPVLAPSKAVGSDTFSTVSSIQMAKANQAFSVALFKQYASANSGNVVLSPVGVNSALYPLLDGANGRTLEEMKSALSAPSDASGLGAGLAKFHQELTQETQQGQLSINAALWLSDQFAADPSFLRATREGQGAQVSPLPMRTDPMGAARTINGWVNRQTDGLIRNIIEDEGPSRGTTLLITSAVYFQGQWKTPFSRAISGMFRTEGGPPLNVQMMRTKAAFRSVRSETFDAIDLPYSDERTSMTVLVPSDGVTLKELETELSEDFLAKALEQLDAQSERLVSLEMPKFELSTSSDLRNALGALGMETAFDPRRADFSRMAREKGLAVSSVKQETYIKVDENGTEAAAATSVGVVRTSLTPPFLIDRPFLFIIRDRPTGAIVFMGRIMKPIQQ